MSGGLATRCPSCGTVFRVVADQLRVSEGWVRCGRCSEVFNASEQLLDLGGVEPVVRAPSPPAGAPWQTPDEGLPAPVHEDMPSTALDEPTAALDFGLEIHEAGPARDEPGHAMPEQAEAPQPMPMPTGGLPDPHELLEVPAEAATAITPATDDSVSAPARAAGTPSFMRRAERAEQWRRPRVRAALAIASALGVVVLAGQGLYAYRDLAAARFAALREPLEAACGAIGCTVGAAHAIESLAVESSGLVRVEKSNVYKLTVAVRNHAGIDLAVPALDLTLTDAQGKLLARRVLRAAEFGVGTGVVAAGADLAFQATLQASTEPIAGYTIDLFYP